MATGTRAASQRSYEDFEPTTEWKREPSADTLLVYLPGFRKEQMKVQVTSSRQLRIMGERPMGNNNNNKWSRFKKEIPIGSNYDTNEINARFDKGILYVKHPKLITQQPQPAAGVNNQPLPSQKPPQPRPAAPVVEAPKPIPPPPPAAAAPQPASGRTQDQKPQSHQPASNGKATAATAVQPPAPASAPPKEASIWKIPPTEPSVSGPPRSETKNPETGMGAKPDKFSEEQRKEKDERKTTNGQSPEPKADEMKKEEGGGSSRGRISSPLIASEKYKNAMSGLGMKVMEMKENPKSLLNLVFAVLTGVVILLYLKNAAKSLLKFKGGADIDDDQLLL
ncbi:unnamed protein product [Linum tenue]|uniref:SHSP domain-containing protein n=1 Tax=Linum tenue TaxID=586396 RepID=A0AAV0IKW9_9ROSI|nr:unnamed protein product [Linum tenue]